ncbi:hypothetical protein [Actinomadura sp. 9N215]|uniref:hypothetical protein n=1 Tax=Actinomadura sp. 9N215 TaxID=3375150 RepID=UPI0037A8005D
MTVHPFDYDAYWRDQTRDDWRKRGLHWHCYTSRMDGNAYGDDPARRDPNSELAPREIRDWLRKPPRAIRQMPASPEEAIRWLRAQWEPVKEQIGREATAISDETRFGTALYNLRCGNDVCWGFWLTASLHLHLAIVATDEKCHP